MRLKLTALLLLASCATADVVDVHADGFGAIKIGMTEKEAKAASGKDLTSAYNKDCYMAYLPDSKDVGFMFESGILTRIDIKGASQLTTLNGAKIGDSDETIKTLFPGIAVTPHKYDYPRSHYLTWQDDNGYLLFETDGPKVSRYRVGTKSVEYVEGCS